METMIDWARAIGAHRLELGVMEHNAGAIALYRKFGFEVEGVNRDAVVLDGKYLNLIMMARIL